jgi:hypothetical protein
MLKRITGLIILSFILSSYDPARVHLQGVIIDKNTSAAIDSAKISIRESTSLFADSLGSFNIVQLFSGFEILVEKKGYQPKYINFSKEKYDMDNIIIMLQPTTKENKSSLSQNELRFLNTLIKIIFSLFNAFTLIFILFKSKIRLKFLWVSGIILINPAFRFLHSDYSLLDYEILNGPFYLFNYWNYPYSLIIAIPAISIIFWIIYLVKRNWIQEQSQPNELIQE